MRRSLALALLMLLVGCRSPEATAETSVDLYDGSIEATSTVLQPGPVAIDIANLGAFRHTLVVTTAEGSVVAATDLLESGGTAHLDVTLPPGDYQFTCRIVATDGEGNVVDHYQIGMVQDVAVG